MAWHDPDSAFSNWFFGILFFGMVVFLIFIGGKGIYCKNGHPDSCTEYERCSYYDDNCDDWEFDDLPENIQKKRYPERFQVRPRRKSDDSGLGYGLRMNMSTGTIDVGPNINGIGFGKSTGFSTGFSNGF